MKPRLIPARHGFAIRDLLALAASLALLTALAVPHNAAADGSNRFTICMSRLKSLGITNAKFANDNQDRIATPRSRNGQTVTYGSPGLGITVTYGNSTFDEARAPGDFAVDAIRRLGNRPDLNRIESWVAGPYYTPIALAAYDNERLPSPRFACPEDANLLAWQANPLNFNNIGVPSPVPPGSLSNHDKRWPYSSSYTMAGSAWSNDRFSSTAGAWNMNNATTFIRRGGLTPNRGDIGHRRMSEVMFPGRKVHLWDRGARHFVTRAVYWNFENTKQPMLYFDGATRTTRTGATDRGWDWANPDIPNRTFNYVFEINSAAQEWMPGFPNGQARGSQVFSAAYFAMTRGGLKGFDLPQ